MAYSIALPVFAFTGYAVATILFMQHFFKHQHLKTNIVLVSALIGLIFHATVAVQSIWTEHTLDFSLANVVILVSLIITLMSSLLALRNPLSLILPITYAFAAILLMVMFVLPMDQALIVESGQFVLTLHIILILAAYCILVMATLYAFQVAYINGKLKKKDIASIESLPPIMLFEKQLLGIIIIGVVLLMSALLVGFIFFDDLFSSAHIHKTTLSLIALAGYLVILWGQLTRGWRGAKLFMMLLTSTSILSLAYFGSRLIREYIL
ncbi:inner membrane protein YpjD [Thalassotalea aquiviva]|uniref:cytochrome C assembly family protein n=1 Tax=Thalassotalea aquiviva TaxID=3242415 RepID=UPI00352BB999